VTSSPLALPVPDRKGRSSACITSAIMQRLRTQRVCAAEDAPLVRSTCIYDPTVLPRWQQDDRGRRNASRGVHYMAPAGAYNKIRPWSGRQHWLTFVIPTAIAANRGVLRAEQLAAATFTLWARVESGYVQDKRTGRRCVVRPDTVASVMGCAPNTVQRCRRVARRLGLQVVVQMGRMLNAVECMAARRRGSCQRGLSTETALTIPDPVLRCLISVTPTRGSARTRKRDLAMGFLRGLAAEKVEAAPPPRPQNKDRRRRKARQLAADLVKIVPWLHGESPRRLSPALTPFVEGADPWTALDLADAIVDHTLRTGRGDVRAERIRTRPAVVLAAILRGLDPQADHPRLHALEEPTATDLVPCDRDDCDGHGWLEGDNAVSKCPDCPPSIRTWRPELDEADADGQPLF